MTVVEAYVGRKKMNPPDDSSQLHSEVNSLLCEGVAQNSTGNVFVPKVNMLFPFASSVLAIHLINFSRQVDNIKVVLYSFFSLLFSF